MIAPEVLRVLGWGADQYCDFQYNTGLKYLQSKCPEGVRQDYERSRIFWNWWKLQWSFRDRRWIESAVAFYDAGLTHDEIMRDYKENHDVSFITSYPTPSIFERREAEMVGKLIDESLKANNHGQQAR